MVDDCVHPGCPAPAATGKKRCYFHDKKARGLFAHACDASCYNPHRDPDELCPRERRPGPRHSVRESAVLDDEQREIADVLEVMGTPAHEIKAAIMRRPVNRTHSGRRPARR